MNILHQIISVLNKEEIRHFKLWLNSTNSSDNRKDVLLFDYIRKSDDAYNEEYIFSKLYSKPDKNSFYRLKHRLQEDIGYNLTLLHTNKNETNHIYHFLSLYQIFVLRNKPEIALYYLKRAEAKAKENENFELLDIIYASYVKLSSGHTGINPEVFIEKRTSNAENLNKIREADQVLAAVAYRLKLSQNYGKRDVGLLKLLDKSIKKFAADDSIKYSKTFQTRVFQALSQILIQNHNFAELEKFTQITYKKFLSNKWFDKANHETKIQMLIYIINATFKNRKFALSLDFAETLGEELSAHHRLFYNKYLFFYYNALVINYAQTDLQRGLRALDEAEREMKSMKNAYYDFFILLNKATLLFFARKTNEAIRNLVRLYGNDHYKQADVSLKTKIAVAECIMQYESGDATTTIKRVEQVSKQFKKQFYSSDFKREKFILKLIPQLIQSPKTSNQTSLVKSIKKFVLTPVDQSVEDGEVLRYRTWLAPKAGLSDSILNK